jgi:para-aminobenzoate synthetase/4-amino-4-deoxychorismate lyase
MEIIRELETAPRGVYTGCVGRVAPGRFARFNVAIRTALIEARGQGAEYGVGGGVVWDSDSRGESRECRVKSRVLTRRQPEFALLETLLWRPEDGFPLIERHLGRLADSAEYFSRKVDLDQIRSLLERTAAGLPARPHRVRLLVHERRPPEAQAAPLEPLPSPWRVRLAARLVNSENVFLWHKTTWRRVYEDALREAPEYNDVLLWNERGECTESLIGNLVAEKDGEWFTPPLEAGLLDGVGRRLLIEQGRLREKTIPKEELTEYDSLRLVNSVRGVWPIELSTDEASSI